MKGILFLASFFCLVNAYADHSFKTVSAKLSTLFERVDAQEISVGDALLAIDENDIDLLLKPSVIDSDTKELIAEGHIACTGAVQGKLCFDLADLDRFNANQEPVIWVTDNIKNDDLCYLHHFAGIFALNEDPSSHAIIVTRVYNIPCITLAKDVIKKENALFTSNAVYRHGDDATLDAFNGRLLAGAVPLFYNNNNSYIEIISDWSERFAELEVHANADNAKESLEAVEFGATGVDPRTEHMFFHPDRLHLFRKVILSKGESTSALHELKELQKADFIQLFQAMKAYPAKIRLLDPPLHEFLPQKEDILRSLSDDLQIPLEQIKNQVQYLQEANPMMGHRGVRLLLTCPEILKMQVRAIFEASLHPTLDGAGVIPHIGVPMVINAEEVKRVKDLVDEVYKEVSSAAGREFPYRLGIMLETPRACLLAKEIAPYIDYVSFGTNDLTGQTLALSRGDVYDKFLKFYLDNGILPADPFSQIDPAVEELMRISVSQIKSQYENVIIGICGEQASQKDGVFICHKLGFDTVSAAAFRIPAVKLFAAQASILHPRKKGSSPS